MPERSSQSPIAPMTIWCISKYASPPSYGLGAKLFFLAREFSRLGHETLLITSDANHLAKYPQTETRYNYEFKDGVQHHWIQTRKYAKTASVDRVLSWIDFEIGLFCMSRKAMPNPDVVIVSSLSLLTILFGYYLKKRYQSLLVFEVRDIWPLTMTAEGGFNLWHPLVLALGFVERFGYKKADLVVGTMPRLDLHVLDTIGYDRPYFCSPLGFAPETLNEDKSLSEGFVNKYFPSGKIIIGYAGSIGLTNALEPLMRCIEGMDDRQDIHFVLVGSGDMKEAYAKRLSARRNVTFVPRVEKSQVQSFLNRCDILYLAAHDSTVWRFGQSLNKLVDYMLAGKPIIASYSGHPSMIDESGAGTFVRANNVDELKKMIEKYADMPDEERRRIGARGREWMLANRPYPVLARAFLEKVQSLRHSI